MNVVRAEVARKAAAEAGTEWMPLGYFAKRLQSHITPEHAMNRYRVERGKPPEDVEYSVALGRAAITRYTMDGAWRANWVERKGRGETLMYRATPKCMEAYANGNGHCKDKK